MEALVKQRKTLQGRTFEPYPESFKLALEQESIETLQNDLKIAQQSLKRIK